ncbi:Chromo (CHRromatin Organization MOdifier) domain [Carpediemonas membranifera]|uniref:Chromo (CHRromatin Organization MOdifier) domain n=1 Tax=Carpediemonas membranifera TaxID=201153 RepID=A0A8J6B4Q7_9EUKA|nr:Chromo (CHRromatin Organization MOdifier) domain [Carpediemonas membranifera]|eukprot:KAG9394279.1 Chromo (CHRromatin Organization MOdifier) domain [Carpediemonas membranifera]
MENSKHKSPQLHRLPRKRETRCQHRVNRQLGITGDDPPTPKWHGTREGIGTIELVLVRYPTKSPSKILAPIRGPVRMLGEGKSPNSYRLQDLVTKAELLVHADRLVPFKRAHNTSLKDLETLVGFEQNEQPVDSIVGHRERNGKLEMLIHWQGLEDSEDSFIPYNAYYDQLAALDSYLEDNPTLRPLFARYKRNFRPHGRR